MHFSNLLKCAAVTMSVCVGLGVSATPLSPEAALNAARGSNNGQMRIAARDMALVHTVNQPDTSIAGVYVFAPQSGEGFIITAADDASHLLLGYSDSGTFDVNNIPPSLNWWLQTSAEKVAYDVKNAPKAMNGTVSSICTDKKLVAKLPAKEASAQGAKIQFAETGDAVSSPNRITRNAIAHLVEAMWNQDSPYNDQCPVIDGDHTYTGCAATAQAQIMKHHQWPPVGIGSRTYEWEWNENTYSDSFDFEANMFDWGSMLNNYDDNAGTATQRSAVARLMHACGVASEMSYGLDGSGTGISNIANGWLTYLNYDKSMRMLWRECFNSEEWGDLIYSELAANRPVYYRGQSTTGGHAFVCDGYDSGDYFHINWGWSGIANGYYYLYNLTPTYSGIGGAELGDGYNTYQQILTNIKPQENGAIFPAMIIYESNLKTENSVYSRSSSENLIVTCPIYSLMPLATDVTIGFKLEDSAHTEYITAFETHLDTYYGYNYIYTETTNFPEGEYAVSLACKTEGSDWEDFMCYDGYNSKLYFNVTSSEITISSTPSETEELSMSAELESVEAVNGTDKKIYTGHSYDFQFAVTSNQDWSGDIYCILINEGYELMQYEVSNVTIPANQPVSNTWRLEIEDLEEGSYIIGLCTLGEDGYLYLMPNIYSIDIYNGAGVDPDPDPETRHGDYNGDGYIDIQDVYYIIDLIHSGAR